MSFFDTISLFGRPKPVEPVKPVVSVPAEMTEEKVKLQSGIDKNNSRIQMYQRKAAEAHKAAKRYKKEGNTVMAQQFLSKKNYYLDLIKTVNVSISHLDQKMMIVEKSEILLETRDDMVAVDNKLGELRARLNSDAVIDAMVDSNTIADEINEIAGHMENNLPFATMGNLDNELDNLSISDDETDIDYNFPAITRTNTTATTTTTTTTSTTKIPEITKSDIMGML